MPGGQPAVFRQIQRLFGPGTVAGLSEGQLLDRFVAGRDDAAFEAIVARHGPMVLAVCRSHLRGGPDVDDAFQATFLILARRAGDLRHRDQLGPWLHGVARRVATRARLASARRRDRAVILDDPVAPAADPDLFDVRPAVHAEVARLPESYRAPVVLCYLEGLTHDEAALALGWPVGTVRGRLARARDLLRDRLRRRGVALGAGAALASVAPGARASVPPALASSTLSIAAHAGRLPLARLAIVVSSRVLDLSQGALPIMANAPLKIAATLLVASGLLTTTAVSGRQAAGTTQSQVKAGTTPSVPVAATKSITAAQPAAPVETASLAAERLRVAEQVVENYKRRIAQSNAAIDETYLSWLRRLPDLRIEAGMPRGDAVQAYLGSIRETEAMAQPLFEKGEVTKGQWNQILFFRLDAEKMLADLQSAPKSSGTTPNPKAPTAPSAAVGLESAFGTAAPPRLRRLPKINPADAEANKLVEQALEGMTPLKFPAGTPLDDVLKYIREHANTSKSLPPGSLRIYVDPLVLLDSDEDPPKPRTFKTLVPIDFEGVPLRVSLRLILDQFSLVYQVRDRMIYVIDIDLLDAQSEGFQELTGRSNQGMGLQ